MRGFLIIKLTMFYLYLTLFCFFFVVDLRVGNLAIPLKKKVDLALLTHAHKRLKTGDVSSTRARVDSDTSLMLVVMPDGGVDGNGGAGFDAGG